jgi:hypothetical protein
MDSLSKSICGRPLLWKHGPATIKEGSYQKLQIKVTIKRFGDGMSGAMLF